MEIFHAYKYIYAMMIIARRSQLSHIWLNVVGRMLMETWLQPSNPIRIGSSRYASIVSVLLQIQKKKIIIIIKINLPCPPFACCIVIMTEWFHGQRNEAEKKTFFFSFQHICLSWSLIYIVSRLAPYERRCVCVRPLFDHSSNDL